MKKLFIISVLLASVGQMPASNADVFLEHDPFGWIMAVISMGVVFMALLILFLCFKYAYGGVAALMLYVKKLFHRQKQLETLTEKRSRRTTVRKEKDNKGNEIEKVVDAETGEEVNDEELVAAIGVALFLNEDGMHDSESDVLTLVPEASAWTGAGNNQKRSPLRKF